jgi:hypothetical protein
MAQTSAADFARTVMRDIDGPNFRSSCPRALHTKPFVVRIKKSHHKTRNMSGHDPAAGVNKLGLLIANAPNHDL